MPENSQPGLFDERPDRKAAYARAEAGMERAADKAERIESGWRDQAIEALRRYALEHETFLTEDVRSLCPTPAEADGRAWGSIIVHAKREGLIEFAHYAHDRYASPKSVWRSKVYVPRRAM